MTKLKIAIQKTGRLSEISLQLLKECGIDFPNGKSKLLAESSNFPLQILFLRDDDIPQYVEQNVADIGIIGKNVLSESGKDIVIQQYLGFSKCKLSLAIPKDINYEGLTYFNNKRIATSYPNILSQFLSKNNINAVIEPISGSVEIAPSIGLADAICDIVSSGSTLLSNGLKEVVTVLESEAILVSNPKLSESKMYILNKFIFRIRAVLASKNYKYILMNAPNHKLDTITNLLPGMKSPTIMPLIENGWSSLHTVVKENDLWTVIDNLKEAGAEGILVIPIEKMIS